MVLTLISKATFSFLSFLRLSILCSSNPSRQRNAVRSPFDPHRQAPIEWDVAFLGTPSSIPCGDYNSLWSKGESISAEEKGFYCKSFLQSHRILHERGSNSSSSLPEHSRMSLRGVYKELVYSQKRRKKRNQLFGVDTAATKESASPLLSQLKRTAVIALFPGYADFPTIDSRIYSNATEVDRLSKLLPVFIAEFIAYIQSTVLRRNSKLFVYSIPTASNGEEDSASRTRADAMGLVNKEVMKLSRRIEKVDRRVRYVDLYEYFPLDREGEGTERLVSFSTSKEKPGERVEGLSPIGSSIVLDTLISSIPKPANQKDQASKPLIFVDIPANAGYKVTSALKGRWNAAEKSNHPLNEAFEATAMIYEEYLMKEDFQSWRAPPWMMGEERLKDLRGKYDFFVVVQNPYERVIIDYYNYAIEVKKEPRRKVEDPAFFNYIIGARLKGMMIFVREVQSRKDSGKISSMKTYLKLFDSLSDKNFGFIPQHLYLLDTRDELIVPFSNVLRIQRLQKYFNRLMMAYNESIETDMEGNGNVRYLTSMRWDFKRARSIGIRNISDENIRLIQQVYKRDFSLLGYPISIGSH